MFLQQTRVFLAVGKKSLISYRHRWLNAWHWRLLVVGSESSFGWVEYNSWVSFLQ